MGRLRFAAGNNGPAPLTVGNPGTAKNVVTVGATENGQGEPDNMADFAVQSEIDGALVGGASLKADSFVAIVKASVSSVS